MTKMIPEKKKLEFQSWEFGVFFHFGIRSFFLGHKDWDNREMPVSAFNPTRLDCRQWIRTARDAGAKYAVLVCKHHDGFANWPTKYSEYSVKSSPWKGGKGDVVAEFVAACREYGVKVGLYYSPAQWGGATAFREGREYDDYFIRQIGELLTNYGKIDYLWFDGCGSEKHQYDQKRVMAEIRRMQPDIRVFEMWDPDTRWVGNEDGYADLPNFNETGATDFERKNPSDQPLMRRYLPVECDCMIRDTWFDCELNEDKLKSVDELVGMYELSVGRGANLLLNIGPDARGLLPDADVKRLLAFGEAIRARYGTPREGFSELQSTAAGGFIESEKSALVNRVILEEDLSMGESVKEFSIYADLGVSKGRRVRVYRGMNIGHKAICMFPTVRTSKLTVEIDGHEEAYRLKSMRAYYVK